MYVRCGYFIGQPVQGKKKELDEQLHAVVEMYRRFPGIRWASMLVADEADVGAPAIYATIQFCFDSKAALEAALATPHRQELRAHYANAVMPLFEGSVQHANQAVSNIVFSI
ncbi:hypothetical protein [Eoetvoesiella caeni]|uniref:Quinol monooxygenase YgiN n=1 Tax=Eoetvoesiella caeni TaxID=645616 RepID=A0A366H5J9_9BURK|nr:hypothetical protein [Eoetvoesiella caeni]MCI2810741.1 hypothetical protein [Eoetvoesiella caeni]NYT55750.1 hypothetical protein [Eoetvoesiella caeni]RBP36475.1 hypothetical protein DFR37_11254 [Eoetvoesiella caeni]